MVETAMGKPNVASSFFGDVRVPLSEGSIKKPRFSNDVKSPPAERDLADLPTSSQSVPDLHSPIQAQTDAPKKAEPQILSGSKEIDAEDPHPGATDTEKVKAIARENISKQDTTALSLPSSREAEAQKPEQANIGISKDAGAGDIAELDTAALSLLPGKEARGAQIQPQAKATVAENGAVADLPTTPQISVVSPVQKSAAPQSGNGNVPEVVRTSTPASEKNRTSSNSTLEAERRKQQPQTPLPATAQRWEQVPSTPTQAGNKQPQTPAPVPETPRDWQQSQEAPFANRPVAPARAGSLRMSQTVALATLLRGKLLQKSRLPIVIAASLLVVILGMVVWIVATDPFSVAAVTKPQTAFNNATMNVALAYPTDWNVTLNQTQTTANFHDSTNTDQASVSMGAGSQDAGQDLAKRVSQLGLTGTKQISSITFAGMTWQQVKGSVQENGASYTATVLVGEHQGHLYTLEQLAPQATYDQAEQYVFSGIRASFHFLS